MDNHLKSNTYKKRSGTSNVGTEYEQLNIANILLKLFEKQIDFEITTNDDSAGDFDDICLTINHPNKFTTAVQLKHSENNKKTVKPEQLQGPKGDFSILKYYHSYIEKDIQADRLILFTNRKFNLSKPQVLKTEEFEIEISKAEIASADYINTVSCNNCYQFTLLESSVKDKSKIPLYNDFFSKFFLYINQENCQNLKKKIQEKFIKLLANSEFDSFINWIKDWWKQEGTVEKLNKKWLQNYLQILFYSPKIQPINFTSTNLNNNENLLKNIISNFKISIFHKNSYQNLHRLWANCDQKLNDIKFINRLISKYQFCLQIKEVTELNNKSKTILLWLLNESPLFVNSNKVFEYVPQENIVFLLKENENLSTKLPNFRNLSDIQCDKDYLNLVEKLSFSVRNKELSLKDFIDNDENIRKDFTSDMLLEMLRCVPCIGGAITEATSDYYQKRFISFNLVNDKFFQEHFQNSLIVIDNVKDISVFKQKFFLFRFVNYNSYDINTLNSLQSTIIYSEQNISLENFHDIVKSNKSKFQNIHKLKCRETNDLQWIASGTKVDSLKKFISSRFESEENIWDSETGNNLNLLTDGSGMGKSLFLQKLHDNYSLKFWPLLLDSKDINRLSISESNKNVLQSLENYLINNKFEELTNFQKQILLISLKSKRVIICWDGLDEINSNNLKTITKVILKISRKKYCQWLTSRTHLRQALETNFNILSRNLKEFDEKDQNEYMRNRLNRCISPDKINESITKIRASFMFIEHNNMLGIPLQIFMLTELIQQNLKYLENSLETLLLTDLYNFFVEEKFKIFIRRLCSESPNHEIIYKLSEITLQKIHKNKSLIAVLPSNIVQKIKIDDNEIQEVETAAGFIKEVDDGIPRFIHQSFAEYFTALFFFENQHLKDILKEFIFKPKYDNVRFFFDLFMANNSKPHVAVLYQNFDMLQKCENNIKTCKDKGGRSALHLMSSWGLYHPDFQILKTENHYVINNLFLPMKRASETYFKFEEFLLANCNNFEKDNFFNMTPLAYAQQRHSYSMQIKLLVRDKHIKTIDTDCLVNMLYYASAFVYNSVIRLIEKFSKTKLQMKKIINCKNMLNMDPLFISCVLENYEMAKFLIQNSAEVNNITSLNVTPLHIAAQYGHLSTVQNLVKARAEINSATKDGETPLYIAALNGHLNVVRYLVEARAEINSASKDGETPLYIAALNGHLSVVQNLVEARAEINSATKDGVTPLHIAAQNGHLSVVQNLVEAGAEINSAAKNDWTPIRIATAVGHIDIVKYLVKCGALRNKPSTIHNLIKLATETNNTEIVQYLQELP